MRAFFTAFCVLKQLEKSDVYHLCDMVSGKAAGAAHPAVGNGSASLLSTAGGDKEERYALPAL
jgi:hypothetical protein